LYTARNLIKVIKSGKMALVRHAAYMGEMTKAYKIFKSNSMKGGGNFG
jgi:effector-binding domain-containing protein